MLSPFFLKRFCYSPSICKQILLIKVKDLNPAAIQKNVGTILLSLQFHYFLCAESLPFKKK